MQSRQSRPLLFNALSASPSHHDLGSANARASDKYEQVVSEYSVSLNNHQQRLPSPSQMTNDISMIEEASRHNNQAQPRFEVYMRCVTWNRDSHGLFDYESRYIAKKNIKTYTGGKVIRLNNNVEFISKHSSAAEHGPSAKPLITVHEKNGKFFVENDTLLPFMDEEQTKLLDEDVNNKMFIVVRNLKTSQNKVDYRLNKGDIVKLGRIKFKVKDFRTDTCPANMDTKGKRQSFSPVKSSNKAPDQQEEDFWVGSDDFSEEAIEIDCGVVESTNNEIQCKVCWSNEQSPQNPLLNSCKCDGSVRFIHYECLKHWLSLKMIKKEEQHLTSFTWKQFECEICKKPYPYVFKSNGRKFRLVDAEVPEGRNFLWLESLTFEKNSSRMVHLIMPDEERSTFKLGRGHESDVRVSDISVSRCHAILKYGSDNNFYLEDNLSKFGTLVLAKARIELEVDQTRAVQIGRSVISFTVKPIQSTQKFQTPSPCKQIKQSQVDTYSMEDVLRKKIEETDLKINQLMNQAKTVTHNNESSVEEAQNFSQYLQSSNYDKNKDYQLNAACDPLSQLVAEQTQNYGDFTSRQNMQQNQAINRTDTQGFNSSFHRFDQMIQNVEQKLAQKEIRYQNQQRGHQAQSFQSPPRLNLRENSQQPCGNDDKTPEMDDLRTQNKNLIAHNEWKYRQLLSDLYNHDDQQSPKTFPAEKQSLSFHQLQAKYGKTPNQDKREDDSQKYEDFKQELQGTCDNIARFDDPPLRLRPQKLESSPAKVDLNKYINAGKDNLADIICQAPQNNRNNSIIGRGNAQPNTNDFSSFGPGLEDNLFSHSQNQNQFMVTKQSQPTQQISPDKGKIKPAQSLRFDQIQPSSKSYARNASSSTPWGNAMENFELQIQQRKEAKNNYDRQVVRGSPYKRQIQGGTMGTIERGGTIRSSQKPSNNTNLTPSKLVRPKETSIDRRAKNSYALQNSGNRRRQTTGANAPVTQTLYQRQQLLQQQQQQKQRNSTIEKSQMRY